MRATHSRLHFVLATLSTTLIAFSSQADPPISYPIGQDLPSDEARPSTQPGRLVSPRASVAVHVGNGVQATAEQLNEVLSLSTRAIDALEYSFRLPTPAPDGTRGGGPELDIYLVSGGPNSEALVDALEYGNVWDRASAFVRLRAGQTGSELQRSVTEAVVAATMLGIDARTPRAWRLAVAASLAGKITRLGLDPVAVQAWQRDPGAGITAHRNDTEARGAGYFIDWLTQRYDNEEHVFLRGLLWGPIARSPSEAVRFVSEPDAYDLLARLLREERGGMDATLTEFSLARARMGTDSDPVLGWREDRDFTPPPARSLTLSQLPAWVTPPRVLAETGMSWVRVATQNAGDRGLNLWFHGAPWRGWGISVVLLDALGHERGRPPSSAVQRGEWSVALPNLRDVHSVVIAITDLGNGEYDPDEVEDRAGFYALNLAIDGAPGAGR